MLAKTPVALPTKYGIRSNDLLDLIRTVKLAISTDETRYYLNGAYFHCDADGTLRAVTCDGHRMVVAEKPAARITTKAIGIIVPRDALKAVEEHCREHDGIVQVSNSREEIRFCFDAGRIAIAFKGIDGTFPDYQRIMPEKNTKLAVVGRKALRNALKQFPRAKRKQNREEGAVTLSFTDSALTISKDECATQRIACDWNDGQFEIGFNPNYLLDALQVLGEHVGLAFDDAGSPVLMMSEEFPRIVIMPCRFPR